MRILISLIITIHSFATIGQLAMGQWRMHVSATQAIDVAYGDGIALASLKTGIIVFDNNAEESRILNNQNGLSDIKTTCTIYHPGTKSFFVGYENGNIDQIYTTGGIVNIPAIKLAQIPGNKRINDFRIHNGKIYVSTGFAIVVIDPVKNEVKDTYNPSTSPQNYISTLFIGDTIFALHSKGMFKASLSNPTLGNPNNWSAETKIPTLPASISYTTAHTLNDELYILQKSNVYGSDTIFKMTSTGLDLFIGDQFDMEIQNFEIVNDKFGVSYENNYILFNPNISVFLSIENYSPFSPKIRAATYGDNCYWVADFSNGLVRLDSNNSYRLISKEGPPKNDCFSISGQDGKIVVTAGTIDRVVLSYSIEGAYTMKDETWNFYDRTNQSMWSSDVWAIGASAINPKNIEEIALGGYCPSGLSIVNGTQVSNVYNQSNSVLENTTLGNNSMCINNLKYDKEGNLWVGNSYALKPLKVRTANGQWFEMNSNVNMTGKFITKMVIDYNGNKWLGTYDGGLIGYNDNGTISNTSDDIIRFMTEGQGSGNLPSKNVTALAADFDNEIWVGTESGLAILYNSSGVFSTNSTTDLSQILISVDGVVEKLLGNSNIADIEIDGGNRKWVGTKESGVFLISADGQEVLANFNTENSPMISNEVYDMEFNHKTGELFIITDNGMVSYRTDASYEDADYASTVVFPNPVKPDYKGLVTIQGIKYASDIKITDATGNLVYKTVSNGGTATWNCKRLTGEDVSSGVYYIWTAPSEGKGKKVGKVLIIR